MHYLYPTLVIIDGLCGHRGKLCWHLLSLNYLYQMDLENFAVIFNCCDARALFICDDKKFCCH
jgi:hypothetical protein